MAKNAIKVVEDGELKIVPHFYAKSWRTWLSNISDWCISRQLWWGHQIPAYQVELPDSRTNTEEERWVWGRTEDEARQRAAVKYGVHPTSVNLTRDPDVLDTWFSSGLFPFAMLGWPEQTADMQHYYPNSILETGSDLIFFWVARMVMLGKELTGQLPFKQVLFHSMVRDKHGRKMSKSLGNVIDPLDVINGVSLERLQEKVMEGNLDPREQMVALKAQKGLNADKQIRQLSQRRDKLVPKLKEILDSLQSPDYLTKVPAHVRHRVDNKRAALQQELNTIECQLKALQEE